MEKLNAKIITGGSLIIDTTEVTLPKVLNSNGYYSGIVGKWYLDLVIQNKLQFTYKSDQIKLGLIIRTRQILKTGFLVYIENGKVVNLDDDDLIEVNFAVNSNFDIYNYQLAK